MSFFRFRRPDSLVLSTILVAVPTLALLVTLQACVSDSPDNDASNDDDLYGYGYGYGKKGGNKD